MVLPTSNSYKFFKFTFPLPDPHQGDLGLLPQRESLVEGLCELRDGGYGGDSALRDDHVGAADFVGRGASGPGGGPGPVAVLPARSAAVDRG